MFSAAQYLVLLRYVDACVDMLGWKWARAEQELLPVGLGFACVLPFCTVVLRHWASISSHMSRDSVRRLGDVGFSDGISSSRKWALVARAPCLRHLYSGCMAWWTKWAQRYWTLDLHFWVATCPLWFPAGDQS